MGRVIFQVSQDDRVLLIVYFNYLIRIEMGNNSSDISEKEFLQKWKVSDQINQLTIWENKENPDQKLQQYNVRQASTSITEKLDQQRKISKYLVNAYTFKKEGFSCQMDNSAKKLFVEKTPLRLSNLADIPYPDIFHLYDATLKGYEQLTAIVGFFSVDEDQIGINEKGQVKVWLNNQFQSNQIIGLRVNENKMVSDLLILLNKVTDNETRGKYPDLAWFISNHDNITFAQARDKFVKYIRTYNNWDVPTALNCYIEHGGFSPIGSWCRKNQSHGFNQQNIRLPEQLYQTKKVQANTYQPQQNNGVIQNTQQTYPVQQNQGQNINYAPQTNPGPSNGFLTYPGQQTFVNKIVTPSSNPQPNPYNTLNLYPQKAPPSSVLAPLLGSGVRKVEPRIVSNLNGASNTQPTSQIQLVRTESQPQQLQTAIAPTLVKQPSQTFGSQINFNNNNTFNSQNLPQRPITTNIVQNVPAFNPNPIQQTAFFQNVQPNNPISYFNQPSFVQNVQPINASQRPFAINARPAVSQAGASQPAQLDQVLSNPPQVVQSISFARPRQAPLGSSNTSNILEKLQGVPIVENKGDFVQATYPSGYTQPNQNRLQQQRVISQTIDIKDNPSLVPNKNILKGSETIDWQDYTNKEEKPLSNFGRSVPYSFNIDQTKYEAPKYETSNRFTPQSDGKSSPEFLALLSQFKAGTGKSTLDTYSGLSKPGQQTYSQDAIGGSNVKADYSYSPSSYTGGSYGLGLDPELQADLQRYKQ